MDRPNGDKASQEWHEGELPAMVELDQSTILALASQYVPGSREEKALLRKLDMRVIVSTAVLPSCAWTDKPQPCVWLLFVMGFLDRANIGNAKTAGLAKDFNLTSTQYSIILLVFFVSYVLFEVPSNLLITRARPSLYLSGIAVLWGIVAACMAATQNWQQLAGVRLVLGFIESGFAPGVAFYLSSWYRRYELASRFAVYYTAVAVAGGCSGLIAGLVTQHLDGAHGIAGWRWLFVRLLIFYLYVADPCIQIIEGAGSSFVGFIVWFFMADWPSTTKWLTPEERLLAAQRLAYDGLGNTQGAHGKTGGMTALRMVVTDWRTWILALLYALVTGAQTIQYFIPTLVASFGWKSWDGQCQSSLQARTILLTISRSHYPSICLRCRFHSAVLLHSRPL